MEMTNLSISILIPNTASSLMPGSGKTSVRGGRRKSNSGTSKTVKKIVRQCKKKQEKRITQFSNMAENCQHDQYSQHEQSSEFQKVSNNLRGRRRYCKNQKVLKASLKE